MTQSILNRIVKIKILQKSPIAAFLRLNKWIWMNLPSNLIAASSMRAYGIFLNALVRMHATRSQRFGTLFLRNRPKLELISHLISQKDEGSTVKIALLACSKGAEVYSILWTLRSTRPDLKVIMHAVDISQEVLEFARNGVYSLTTPELAEVPIFGRMTEEEMQEMFDKEGDKVRIKSWIREGIIWHIGDAGDKGIINALGPQDIVVANNFLCHMDPPDAEKCLRNIARLVNPDGYLFVSGIDLDIRTKIANDLGWNPVQDLLEEIHDGDPSLRVDWPWKYWGLEPLNKRRYDWQSRYASVFQLNEKT